MYSELCEKLYEQNADNYIAIFNELDKYLDGVVGSEKFLPYNEKLKELTKSEIPLSLFVKKYQKKLKYFWELRNHIAHWFSIEWKHYATPSYHAVDELRKIKEAIIKPVAVGDVFKKQVYTCLSTDSLKEVMQAMRNFHYTHVPVYNEKKIFQWILSHSALSDWIIQKESEWIKDFNSLFVSDVDLTGWNERHIFVSATVPLFSVPALFEQTHLNQKKLGSIFITQTWSAEEPLLGVITTFDLPTIMQYSFVQ